MMQASTLLSRIFNGVKDQRRFTLELNEGNVMMNQKEKSKLKK